jgi:putative ABC transport system permease protein
MPGKAALQKGLVVLQFVISSLLITSAIVVYYQLDFMKNKKLGFQKENILIVPLRDQANQHNYEPLKQRWLQNPSIKAVTATSGVPTREEGLNDFQVKPKQSAIDSFNMLTLTVDHDFVKTYGMEIVAGRDFSKEFITDTSSGFLINESAAKLFGWNDPVNQELTLEYYFNRRINKTGKVVGVVKDFHYHSLRQKMTPLLMHITPGTYYNDFLSVKVSTENIAPVISFLQKEWQAYNPSRPFEYMFLDEYYGKLYKSENRFGSVILLFSLLAIGIACVGLFALVSFVCKQRIKEIGIRKVMGASVGGITALLSKDFLKLALLSAIIASPLAWWAMNKWLQDFAYRIDITWWMLTIAAIAVVLIALVTVSFQAIKAALSNPVKALRSE